MEDKASDEIIGLFTQIGILLEDASVIALIWTPVGGLDAKERLTRLCEVNLQISCLLDRIASKA